MDLVSFPIERQRVGARFGRHHLHAAHGADIDHVDDAGITDGDVKVPGLRMQENDVGDAAQADVGEHMTRRGVDREQDAGIAGANSRPVAGSSSSPCGPAAGTSYCFAIMVGSRASIATIRAGDAILTKNISRAASVDRPTGAIGNFDFSDPLPARHIHDRD